VPLPPGPVGVVGVVLWADVPSEPQPARPSAKAQAAASMPTDTTRATDGKP
jgi:hypothetical protein